MKATKIFLKYLLFLSNLIVVITALVVIITGVVVQVYDSDYLKFLGNEFFDAPILLIIVGLTIFSISFFGCCGAIKESRCMTMTFSFLLAFALLIEVGIAITAYMLRSDVKEIVEIKLKKEINNYGQVGHEHSSKAWDAFQHELHCCGAEGIEDWKDSKFGINHNNSVPDSCCINDVEGCGSGVLMNIDTELPIVYTDGCIPKFEEIAMENIEIIAGIGGGVAIIQMIGITFACILSNKLKSDYEAV